jgi:hypothetical protein
LSPFFNLFISEKIKIIVFSAVAVIVNNHNLNKKYSIDYNNNDVVSALGYLQSTAVTSVVYILEIHAASTLGNNTVHIHLVQSPRVQSTSIMIQQESLNL